MSQNKSDIYKIIMDADVESLAQCIRLGVDVNAKGKDGRTPLFLAGFGSESAAEMMNMLLDAGADFYTRSNDLTLFEMAINQDYADVISVIMDRGFKLEDKDGKTLYPLHEAADRYAVKVTEMLVKRDCDVNQTDGKGKTALHIVCHKGPLTVKTKLITLLVHAGADVSIQDDDGNTPGTYMYPPYNYGANAQEYENIVRRYIAGKSSDQFGEDDSRPRVSRRNI